MCYFFFPSSLWLIIFSACHVSCFQGTSFFRLLIPQIPLLYSYINMFSIIPLYLRTPLSPWTISSPLTSVQTLKLKQISRFKATIDIWEKISGNCFLCLGYLTDYISLVPIHTFYDLRFVRNWIKVYCTYVLYFHYLLSVDGNIAWFYFTVILKIECQWIWMNKYHCSRMQSRFKLFEESSNGLPLWSHQFDLITNLSSMCWLLICSW